MRKKQASLFPVEILGTVALASGCDHHSRGPWVAQTQPGVGGHPPVTMVLASNTLGVWVPVVHGHSVSSGRAHRRVESLRCQKVVRGRQMVPHTQAICCDVSVGSHRAQLDFCIWRKVASDWGRW